MGRIYNSARSVGTGRWALELALDYASTRQAFGEPIANYQGVTFPLAESASELLRSPHGDQLGYLARPRLPRGQRTEHDESLFGTNWFSGRRPRYSDAWRHGIHERNRSSRRVARVRVVNVADGTNEILNKTVVQRLFKGDLEL